MRVIKRGFAASVAMFAIGAVALAGCSSSGSGGGSSDGGSGDGGDASGEIVVWVDANRAPVIKDAADQFTADTGIKVTIVQKEFDDIDDQFVQQVPAGEGPDIAVGAHDWLGTLVTNGVVAPIELGDTAADYQEVAIDAWTYDGKVYGVPYSIENIALVRNTDLVSEAPTSWDDMIAKGEEAGTKYPFLVGLDPANADPYHLYPFQTSFGAPVFGQNEDGSYNADDLQIGNDGGEEFAQWLAEQGESGILNTNISADLAKESFNSGESPFFLTGPWNIADAEAAGINLAIDPIPSPGGEDAQPFVGVQGFFLSAKSENVVAATKFLTEYVGSEEVQMAFYEVGKRAPALTAAFDKAVAEDEIVAGFGEVGADAVPMPNIPEMGGVWEFWGATEAAIINGDGDPAELWEKMTSDIEGTLGG